MDADYGPYDWAKGRVWAHSTSILNLPAFLDTTVLTESDAGNGFGRCIWAHEKCLPGIYSVDIQELPAGIKYSPWIELFLDGWLWRVAVILRTPGYVEVAKVRDKKDPKQYPVPENQALMVGIHLEVATFDTIGSGAEVSYPPGHRD